MSVFELWLPILLAGLATHIASTLAWTVSPHHKPEWRKLGAQAGLKDWLAANSVEPGQYVFPHPEDGPPGDTGGCQGTLILWPQPPNMGVNIGLTISFFMVVSFVIGYLASLALPAGAEFMKVLQFVFTAGVLTHMTPALPNAIWFRRKIGMELLDGLVFATLTGLIFAALWPGASA